MTHPTDSPDYADPTFARTRSAAAALAAWRTSVTATDPTAWVTVLRGSVLNEWETLGVPRARAQADLADAIERAPDAEDVFLEAAWVTLRSLSPEDREILGASLGSEV